MLGQGATRLHIPIIAPDAVVLFANGPLILDEVLSMFWVFFVCFFSLYLPVRVTLVGHLSIILIRKQKRTPS